MLAFPGSSFGTFKPEIAVLTTLLGGQPNVKWSHGFSLLAKAAAASPGVSASATNLTYSDAGLLAIQISGTAASVRKTAKEAVKALRSIAAGSTSKEDLTKAVAKAKFDALDASQSGVSTLVSAGSGIVQTGKPYQIAETVQSIGSVTADKLQTVSPPTDPSLIRCLSLTIYVRLRRLFSTVRLQWLRLATCMYYPLPRNLA